MDESKASLFKKLATVMGDMNNIPKTGVNTYFKYKFVTAEAIADAVRQRLASQNVAFFASISKRELVTIPTGKTDKNGEIITVNRWVIDFEFTFADGDTGATDTRLWSAEAGADDDKGINKCATAAEKYFFLKTFIVNTGDEPDADADDGQRSSNGVKQVSPKQPSAAVRGAGIQPQPQRPTPPPTVSTPLTTGTEGASDDPDAPDEDLDLYHCNRLKINQTKTATQYILFVEKSATRITVTDLIVFEGLTLNGKPIIELPPGDYPLEPTWSVHADNNGRSWDTHSIETEMAF